MKVGQVIALLAVSWFQGLTAGEGYADLVEKVRGAVVNIQTTQEARESSGFLNPFDFFGRRGQEPRPRQGSGAGFIITPDGYIVTNRHVVSESEKITVVLEGNRRFEGKVVGVDDGMDVALVKIEADELDFLAIGDSDDMRIGDVVLAMGFPLQLGFSVTKGIISGIGRNMGPGGDLASYIQTDADITFGNSGGPLINQNGEVIGINTLIVSQGETFGFAIPSNMFLKSVEQLKRHGKVRRGALGVGVNDLTPEAMEYYDIDHGALVASVTRGLPADRAGIEREDVILEVNGDKVSNSNDVVKYISGLPPGARVQIRVLSRGRIREKTVTLADRQQLFGGVPSEPSDTEPAPFQDSGLGFSVAPLDRETREEHQLQRTKGLVISEVTRGSLAQERGVTPGAILTHVNKQPVESLEDIEAALAGLPTNAPVPIRILDVSRASNGENSRTIFLRKR